MLLAALDVSFTTEWNILPPPPPNQPKKPCSKLTYKIYRTILSSFTVIFVQTGPLLWTLATSKAADFPRLQVFYWATFDLSGLEIDHLAAVYVSADSSVDC